MIETNIKRTAKASAKHRPHFGFTQCFDDPACFHEPAIGLVPGRATMNFKYGIEELINILDRWPCQIAAGLVLFVDPTRQGLCQHIKLNMCWEKVPPLSKL